MFHVGRFDPRQEDLKKRKLTEGPTRKEIKEKKSKKAKRTKNDNPKGRQKEVDNNESTDKDAAIPTVTSSVDESPALKVIAPETSGPSTIQKNLHTKLTVEAFDDLDLVDDSILEVDDKKGANEEQEDKVPAIFDPHDEVQTALFMSRQPIQEAAAGWGLAPFLIQNLLQDGYHHFFPIQALVIPDVITTERHAHLQARDVCVAAPTGSGKTLSFVLPVLNALAKRQIRRLRALVVLPSRDLAKQVFDVFDRYTEGSDLKIGLAIGQSDFVAEQKALTISPVDDESRSFPYYSTNNKLLRYAYDPGNLELAIDIFSESDTIENTTSVENIKRMLPVGGVSAVDVLVCTPGRLVDHLDNTAGFTLQHLRFLVIDEADRLLSQSYHGWIGRVFDSANSASVAAWHNMKGEKVASSPRRTCVPFPLKQSPDGNSFVLDPITWRRGGTMGDDATTSSTGGGSNRTSIMSSVCRPVQLRKLLYSATLTRDPQKLAALRLVNPKHFDAHHLTSRTSQSTAISSHLYSMPDTLEESTVECTAEQKPLVLLALLLDHREKSAESKKQDGKSIIVVFTSSLESTHRLARLLQLLWGSAGYGDPSLVAEFSSALNQSERSSFIKRCNDPNDPISVIVCSDGMSRGMDIQYVSAVINYDVPGFAKTYVHRCGRTARAGKGGVAITLLKGRGQAGQFTKVRRLIDHPNRVQSIGVKKSLIRDAVPVYRSCMVNLKKLLQAEEEGTLKTIDNSLDEWLHKASK